MADPKQQADTQLLTCPYCQGSGEGSDGQCLGCHGVKLAAWNGQQVRYWGREINAWQIYQEQTQANTKNILNASLLLFGVIGVVALGQWLLATSGSLPAWQLYRMRHWQLLVFWLSAATDTYLFYRLNRQLEGLHTIPKRAYQTTAPNWQPIGWEQITQLPAEQKIDVSVYLTADARTAVTKAWQLAQRYRQAEVMPIHLLVALLSFDQI